MTTYKDPFYRGETAHILAQYCSKSDLIRDNNKGIFDYFVESSGNTGGIPDAGYAYDLALNGKLDKFLNFNYATYNSAFSSLIGSLNNVHVGFLACSRIVRLIWDGTWSFLPDLNWNKMRATVSEIFTAGLQASYGGKVLPDKALDGRKGGLPTDKVMNIERLENAALQILHLKSLAQDRQLIRKVRTAKITGKEFPKLRGGVVFETKGIDIYRYKNVTVIRDIARKQDYILITKDLTRISQTLRSFSLVLEYFDFKGKIHQKMAETHYVIARQYLKLIIECFANSTSETVNLVAQAFDSVYFLWLAKISSDLTDINVRHMQEKMSEKKLDKIVDVDSVFRLVADLKIEDAGDIMKIYKAIHVPDYCPNSALRKFQEMHYDCNPIADEALYKEFLQYRRLAFIRQYNRKYGRNPGKVKEGCRFTQEAYYSTKSSNIKFEDVPYIDLKGSLKLKRYDAESVKFVKDKKTCPVESWKIYDKKGKETVNEFDENYALGYLHDENLSSEKYVLDKFHNNTVEWAHNMKSALKPESKKPDARLFQIGNRYDRLMLSVFEDNVGEFISGKPGVFIGVDNMKKKRILRDSTSLLRTMDRGSVDQLIISFDLKSFSPRFNPRAKEDMFSFWGEIFDEPAITNSINIFKHGKPYWDKFGLLWSYELQGNDIEGFSARANTDWHVDLMAFTIRKLKAKKLVSDEAFLACLIDDGLLKLTFKQELTEETAMEIIKEIDLIYAAAGVKISYDKTLISKKVGIFLNEVVYSGTIVDFGVKSYMKIGPDKKNPLNTFVDEINEIYSNAQGAANSGANWFAVYYRYVKEIVKSRCTWDRFDDSIPELDSIKFFTPVPLGGYGVHPLLTVVSNESHDQITTGVSVLRNLAIRFPSRRKLIAQVLNTEKTIVTARAFLRNPAIIRIEGPTLGSKRYLSETELYLDKVTRNPIIRDVLDKKSDKNLQVLANKLRSTTSVNSMVVTLAYASTPEFLIDNIVTKFASSSTIADLLPARTKIRILIQNAQDFRANARWWKRFA